MEQGIFRGDELVRSEVELGPMEEAEEPLLDDRAADYLDRLDRMPQDTEAVRMKTRLRQLEARKLALRQRMLEAKPLAEFTRVLWLGREPGRPCDERDDVGRDHAALRQDGRRERCGDSGVHGAGLRAAREGEPGPQHRHGRGGRRGASPAWTRCSRRCRAPWSSGRS